MSEKQESRTTKPAGWRPLKQELATWDRPALLTLVKDLYEMSASNRDFVQARCGPKESADKILEKYRNKIVEQFYPLRGEAKLKLGEVRKAISEYRKASGNVPGTAELLMTYVENGAEFTHDYGDIDERFYASVESALNELATLLLTEAPDVYPQLSERLTRVEELTQNVGWGFHDYISDVVAQLEDEFSEGS